MAADCRKSAVAFASFWADCKESKKTRQFEAAELWRVDCLCTGWIDEQKRRRKGVASALGKAIARTGEVTEMSTKEHTIIRSARVARQPAVAPALLLTLIFFTTAARGQGARVEPGDGVTASEAGDVSETSKKLANPLSNVWALFTEFDLNSSDGYLNPGHQQVGGRTIFQPILPIPLFGGEEKEWKLITRPTIPFLSSQPIPTGPNKFDRKGGIGDIQVPLIISPPVKNWILGVGPTLLFPSATDKAFGRQQWGVGPAVVVGTIRRKSLWVSSPSISSELNRRTAAPASPTRAT